MNKRLSIHQFIWIGVTLLLMLVLGGCSDNIMIALHEITPKQGDKIFITNRSGLQSEWVIIDSNADGLVDGIDITLDGAIDIPFVEMNTQQGVAIYSVRILESEYKIEINSLGNARLLSSEERPLTFDAILIQRDQNGDGSVKHIVIKGLGEL